MEWLEQQHDLGTEETGDSSGLTLLDTIKASHVQLHEIYGTLFTIFFVSELSGSFGIASTMDKPSLSVMYPGTDKLPLILSRDERYTSALFTKIAGQEYLAAASRDGIRLWNLTRNTECILNTLEERRNWHLCVIDERTVACVAEQPTSDGFTEVYILNTDSEKFNFSGMLQFKAGDAITDMCHMKTTDGTSCLLLSFPLICLIQCVEMVGGKVRWQVDQQKMSRSFFPCSICFDSSTVFVADPVLNRLHLLSAEDGSMLKSIGLRLRGIRHPSCVRTQGEHLYVGHMNKKRDTYCISKFSKPTAV